MKFFGLTLAVLLVAGFVAIEARSVEKRNVLNDLVANAQSAFNDAKAQFGKFFGSALQQQIAEAKESFMNGLKQLQESAEDLLEDGADALMKNLPGLQGIVSDRVDAVTDSLESYIEKNKGKLDEVRQLILDNALKTLKALKDRLDATESAEAVSQILTSVDNVENQVVSEVSAAKSRSLFGINWSGLKNTITERFDALRNRFDDMLDAFRGEDNKKIREQKGKIQGAMEKVNGADKLPPAQKIEAVKAATAELDKADEVAASAASSGEIVTSPSA
ncbi:uncharacterized protein LOC128388875 [Panonychus citri]|uniref:uncharacterized protein LOC128388875 n=1 Tax=Panonychus citri TaxID=50023 RepID=UPI002307AC13|nr:uncharacterized protein LOC128388875 [Panonychus citri]